MTAPEDVRALGRASMAAVAAGPVWNLLGGRVRRGILSYTHASGRSVSEAIDQTQALREQGYRAVRVQALVPGIAEMYGVPTAADPKRTQRAA